MLSKVQIKVLKQLKEKRNETILYLNAFDPHAFFRSNMKTVSLATFHVLLKKGMLKIIKTWRGGEYKISDKGIRAIGE